MSGEDTTPETAPSDLPASPIAGINDLSARLAEALNTTLVTLDGDIKTATDLPWDRHDKHRFLYNCAMCQGNVPAVIAAVMAVLAEDSGSEVGYWQRETQRARAERDALALRLLQMADAWEERFTETGVRDDVVAAAVRQAVEFMGAR